MNYDVSVYQSTGHCPYISVLNLVSQDNFGSVLTFTVRAS